MTGYARFQCPLSVYCGHADAQPNGAKFAYAHHNEGRGLGRSPRYSNAHNSALLTVYRLHIAPPSYRHHARL